MNNDKIKAVNETWLLILTSIGTFMALMDSMIVSTASTAIREDFNISIGSLQWTMNAYNITMAAILLIGVAIGNRLGHRKVYNIGLLIFVIGSVFCALSSNISFLVVSRVIEGVGASVITPMSMAILSSSISVEERGKALGIWSGVGGLALIVGPALGGFIVSSLSWQWIFWINVPIGLITIFLSQRKLPNTFGTSGRISPLDGILVILASTGIIWTLTESGQKSANISTAIIGVVSVLLTITFIVRQKSEENPMIPLKLFHVRAFTGGVIGSFLLYASMYGVVFFLPQYFQVVNHASALTSGLQLLPWTGSLFIVAPLAGKVVDKVGERPIAIAGLLLQSIGYLWISFATHPTSPYWIMIIPLILSGAGISMAGPALQKAVLGAVSPNQIGTASGIFNMFRLLGGAAGVAISVLIFYSFGGMSNVRLFSRGFVALMLCSCVVSFLGSISSLLLTTENKDKMS